MGVTTKTTNLLLLLNNAGNATTAAAFHKYSIAFAFSWVNESGLDFYVRKYDSAGKQGGTNLVSCSAWGENCPKEWDHENFKFTVIVDSTPDDGCLVTVFVNDQYMTSFALDNNYDVKKDSTIEWWTEKAGNVSMDNITVKNYKAK